MAKSINARLEALERQFNDAGPDVEDDPSELIELLMVQHQQMDDTTKAKKQFRWALEKLIHERVLAELERFRTVP